MMPETQPSDEASNERQLCVGCLTPNDPSANFCVKCGAPLSSLAAITPFERIFSEGYIYRRAIENPHKPIIAFTIWALSVMGLLSGSILVLVSLSEIRTLDKVDVGSFLLGGLIAIASLMAMWRVTQNFLSAKKAKSKQIDELHE